MLSNKSKNAIKYVLLITVLTFFIAAILSAYSQNILSNMEYVYISFILLVVIIVIGIIFDVIGVAVAAANPAPLNAKASRKIVGAATALNLLKKADKVSSICNDVVGDISGTLSGGIGAAIALSMSFNIAQNDDWLPAAIMSGIVAALTVGGKACGKSYAIKNADEIIFNVGRIVYALKYIFTLGAVKKR